MTQDADLYRRIGKRLRTRRRSIELTQAEVARACDTTFQQIQRHEAGERAMTVDRLLRLAEVLQVPLGYFLEASVEEAYPPLADQRQAGAAGR
jgi:transcriptional regulator with XRE-family HTH domain